MGSRQGTRWLAWAAGASLVSGVISGCGDSGAEQTVTPTTASASAIPTTPAATPSPLVTAVPLPVMPPEMANNDAAGAEAAVRYFVDLYTYTHISQDLVPWLAATDADCVFCQSAAESVQTMVAGGERQSGGRVVIESLQLMEASEDLAAYSFEAVATQEYYEIRTSDGDLVESKETSTTTVGFVVAYVDRQWKLIAGGSVSDS